LVRGLNAIRTARAASCGLDPNIPRPGNPLSSDIKRVSGQKIYPRHRNIVAGNVEWAFNG